MALVLLPVLVSSAAPSAVSAPANDNRPREAPRPTDARLVQYSFASTSGAVIPVDGYLPVADSGVRPAVIYLHGGGWREGTRTSFSDGRTFPPVAHRLVRAGFVVFSVEYRLAPLHPFPASSDDVAAAVRWVRGNAARLGVDPARIGMFGTSAGGTLAALVATSGSGATDTGSRVRAVVSWSGPMALRPLDHAFARNPDRATMVSDYLGCDPDRCPETAADASPVNHVDPTDPPMMLVNALHEFVPPGQATWMSDVLRRNGVRHVVALIRGSAHAGQYDARVWDSTVWFLHRELGWPAARRPTGALSG
jgi:acetyl esterase/lipase